MTSESMVLSPEHRAFLNQAAITDTVLEEAGVHTRGTSIAFPWRWEGTEVTQLRPDAPDPGSPKYVWPTGQPFVLSMVRPRGTGPVLLVEGTKQSLAVASWAPDEYTVVGMAGCWGWAKSDLSVFADRDVFVVLDADASDNPGVYDAGARLAYALDLEDARVSFVRLPAADKEGADDYLSSLAEDKRTARLAKLIGKARPKPADRKPTGKGKPQETGLPDTGGRPGVAVNLDRRDVINKVLEHLKDRLDATELFDFGGVLTRLRKAKTEPLSNGAFLRLLTDTVACFHYTEATATKPAVFSPAWPDAQTVQAVMSSSEEFSPLHRVVRNPFVRSDGTVCLKAGYDPESAAVVFLEPGMDRVRVADDPTAQDAADAALYLLDDWLSDMPFETPSDRANALALVLTLFIRGSVPLAPMGVVSGLQRGVGKNLFADCVSIMATGSATEPMSMVDNEDELRKQITSVFGTGTSFIVFDEAHVIESKELARALTSLTWRDRILGVSRMVDFPNQVTWLALGNRNQVNGDMGRRVFWISLHPKGANPEDRDNTSFRYPDLREWTHDNRPELVSAALTMVRAWFAAGQPRSARTKTMGSFEKWDRMMSGILSYAGVDGFLEDLIERRSESDFNAQSMAGHLMWVWEEFGPADFVTREVKSAAGASDRWVSPPGLEDYTPKDWTRKLGKAYFGIRERWYTVGRSRVRVMKSGLGHASTVKWRVEFASDDGVPSLSAPVSNADAPVRPGVSALGGEAPVREETPENDPFESVQGNGEESAPDLSDSAPVSNADALVRPEETQKDMIFGGVGRDREGTLYTPHSAETHFCVTREYPTDMCFYVCSGEGGTLPIPPIPPILESAGQEPQEEQITVNLHTNRTDRDNHGKPQETESGQDGASAIETGADPGVGDTSENQSFHGYSDTGPVGLDFETLPADRLWSSEPGSFVRLVGAGPTGNVTVTPETALCGPLTASGTLVGHNLAGFDLLAAERHLGLPVEETMPRMHDVRLVAFQADPPHSAQTKPGPGFKSYSLDALAHRYLDGAKSADGKALVKEFGGWDMIPVDDPRYVDYCRDDVELAIRLAGKLPLTDYDRREAAVTSVTSRATLEGFRVDVEGLTARVAELAQRSTAGRSMLAETYGFPLTNKQGKPSAAPQRTGEGKRAFEEALKSLGFPVSNWPRGKDGSLSLSKETMTRALEWAEAQSHPAADVIRAVQEMNGVRNNAANLLRYTVDGRVHPLFSPFQATGRWSVQEPGLTVLKKGGEDSERAFLLPEEAHVLVSIDLDQVDIRCVAAHSQDPNLIAIMNNPSRDIHSEVATMAFGSPEGKNRFHAKSLDLGWLYGRTVNGLSRTPGITRNAAERVDESMRNQFTRVMEWQNEVRDRASSGALLDNGFGRRLRCEPGREFTQAPAMMGQSTTRDLIAEGLLDMRRRAPEMLPMLRVIVHDEIVLSVPEKNAEECARVAQDCLSREWVPAGLSRPVRFTAGQGKPFVFGRNWLEAYG